MWAHGGKGQEWRSYACVSTYLLNYIEDLSDMKLTFQSVESFIKSVVRYALSLRYLEREGTTVQAARSLKRPHPDNHQKGQPKHSKTGESRSGSDGGETSQQREFRAKAAVTAGLVVAEAISPDSIATLVQLSTILETISPSSGNDSSDVLPALQKALETLEQRLSKDKRSRSHLRQRTLEKVHKLSAPQSYHLQFCVFQDTDLQQPFSTLRFRITTPQTGDETSIVPLEGVSLGPEIPGASVKDLENQIHASLSLRKADVIAETSFTTPGGQCELLDSEGDESTEQWKAC